MKIACTFHQFAVLQKLRKSYKSNWFFSTVGFVGGFCVVFVVGFAFSVDLLT
ncbi:hypothetical protein HanRHA438_Chr10g0469311 [Helianthus annuus]|nr:hypothetical protein HanRHA438_Chr10g0469311 [Helianthus annuus]